MDLFRVQKFLSVGGDFFRVQLWVKTVIKGEKNLGCTLFMVFFRFRVH